MNATGTFSAAGGINLPTGYTTLPLIHQLGFYASYPSTLGPIVTANQYYTVASTVSLPAGVYVLHGNFAPYQVLNACVMSFSITASTASPPVTDDSVITQSYAFTETKHTHITRFVSHTVATTYKFIASCNVANNVTVGSNYGAFFRVIRIA
jgi:hypothetical protein